jgi:hypothetical protein
MRILISACTDRAFTVGLMPMAHLTIGSASAVNDNSAQTQSRWKLRLHRRHSSDLTRRLPRKPGVEEHIGPFHSRLVSGCPRWRL